MLKKEFLMILMVTLSWSVEASDKSENTNEVEPRGKAKYALLTNLAIVIAAKVGLYKLVLAIALTVASLKMLLILVFASIIYKHVPDPYLHYQKTEQFVPFEDKFAHHREVHFFYVVATKLIVLKIVYGALLFVLLTKGWKFLLWFVHYLKHKKHEHYEYIEDHHFDHHDYSHFDHSYGPVGHSYDHFDHQPYGYDKYGYGSDNKKRIYDADGSYAVKG